MRIISLLVLSLFLVASLSALNGCGRKGKLYEPSYGEPYQKHN